MVGPSSPSLSRADVEAVGEAVVAGVKEELGLEDMAGESGREPVLLRVVEGESDGDVLVDL